MYLTKEGKSLHSNGILLVDFLDDTVTVFGLTHFEEEPATYVIGWDKLTKEYKAYAKKLSQESPNIGSYYEYEERKALNALAYGNTIDLDYAKELFSHIDFVDDYLEDGGGIKKRCPEYFL